MLREHQMVRVTLDIADDVLQAAKEIANAQKATVGQVISDLARKGLNTRGSNAKRVRNSVPVIPSRGEVISLEHVRKLMDAEGI